MNPLRRFATAALVALMLASLALPNAHATPITLATWTAASGAPTVSANGTLTVPNAFSTNLTLTTRAQENAGSIFTTNWGSLGWSGLSSLGTITSPTNSSIAIGYNGATNTQTIQSSVELNNFYMFINYVDTGSFDFSNWSGTIQQVSTNVATTGGSINLAGKTVTINDIFSGGPDDGFVLYFTGATLPANTNFAYNISGLGTSGFSVSSVPEPGTLLLGGIAAACGGGGVWWKRRRRISRSMAPSDRSSG